MENPQDRTSRQAPPDPTPPGTPSDMSASGATGQVAKGPMAPLRPVPLASILTVFGIAILLAALWSWKGLILLTFAAILVAIALRAGGRLFNRYLKINVKLGILLTVVLVVLILIIIVNSVGPAIGAQFSELISGLPAAWQQVLDWLDRSNFGSFLERSIRPGDGSAAADTATNGLPQIFGFLTGTIGTVFGGLANLVLMITMSIFMALDGPSYRNGALRLVPIPYRPQARVISDELSTTLGRWMAGQAVDMVAVALMTGLGLWLLGMPLAMVLGLIAGLTNVIPYIGPFLSGVPAVLFGLTQGFDMAIYVLLLFIFVQQFEGNVLLPIIQKFASDLPPVLTVMGIVAFGGMFGFAGILLATPLVLVLIVLTKRLYIEGILGDHPAPRTRPIGEDDAPGQTGAAG